MVDEAVNGVAARSDGKSAPAVGKAILEEYAADGRDEGFKSDASVSFVVLDIGERGLLRGEAGGVDDECKPGGGMADDDSLWLIGERLVMTCDMPEESAG